MAENQAEKAEPAVNACEHHYMWASPSGTSHSARLCMGCGQPDPAWLDEIYRAPEKTLREHADTIGETLKTELLVELDRQIDDYEAKALPVLAERIRENADAFARFAADKKAAVLLVALLIEHAGRDGLTTQEARHA